MDWVFHLRELAISDTDDETRINTPYDAVIYYVIAKNTGRVMGEEAPPLFSFICRVKFDVLDICIPQSNAFAIKKHYFSISGKS